MKVLTGSMDDSLGNAQFQGSRVALHRYSGEVGVQVHTGTEY